VTAAAAAAISVDTIRTAKDAPLRLSCFPWSGPGASTFRLWASAMPDEIALTGIRLPGRGNRRGELVSDRLAYFLPPVQIMTTAETTLPAVTVRLPSKVARWCHVAGPAVRSRVLTGGHSSSATRVAPSRRCSTIWLGAAGSMAHGLAAARSNRPSRRRPEEAR
jgi:hypothetical protein